MALSDRLALLRGEREADGVRLTAGNRVCSWPQHRRLGSRPGLAAGRTRHLGHVDGQTEALLHITHARAYAATGENPSAARALLAAEDALLREDGPQPGFSRVSGPAAGTVASHTARTLTDLADHIGTEQQHRDALTRWDPEKYKRVHALTHADLGDSLAAQARADEAVAASTQALVLMEGMTSDRTRKAITSIRSTLAVYQRRLVPGAADLARRAREALA